jgi:DNA repair protein RecO (recombination protein O)
MSTEQTDGIVLRLIPFSETSLILTLYTRDLGRVSAIAKGARRPKSVFEGALDLLSICRIVVICKSNDTLDLLTEAKLQRRFRAGQRSLVRLYCGYYVAELLRLWTDDGVASDELYDLTVRAIGSIDGDGDALMSVIHFELQAMRILGNIPATDACVACGGPLNPHSARVPFAYQLGGVLCDDCRARNRDVVSVRRHVIDSISTLQRPGTPIPDVANSAVDGSGGGVVREAATGFDTASMGLQSSGRTGESGRTGPPCPVEASSTVSRFAESRQVATGRVPEYRELRATLNRYITTSLGAPPRTQSLLPANWVSH